MIQCLQNSCDTVTTKDVYFMWKLKAGKSKMQKWKMEEEKRVFQEQ
jgi:hypothetical protein